MNHQFDALPEYKQLQQVQSFYEPALRILNELIERTTKPTCVNAAITRPMLHWPGTSSGRRCPAVSESRCTCRPRSKAV
jgi:hypothetical protein